MSDVQHFPGDGNLVSGQGSGKSTLVEQLVALLKHTGKAAVDVSIDDFYLRFQVPADSMCRRLCTCGPQQGLQHDATAGFLRFGLCA